MRNKLAALTGTAIVFASLANAPTASAEADPQHCPRGNVCAMEYNGVNDRTVVRTTGNWQGSVFVKYVFNNGYPSPGADHIQATWIWEGKPYSRCLHYNPGPGEYKISFPSGVTLTSLTWRGEC